MKGTLLAIDTLPSGRDRFVFIDLNFYATPWCKLGNRHVLYNLADYIGIVFTLEPVVVCVQVGGRDDETKVCGLKLGGISSASKLRAKSLIDDLHRQG